MITTQCRATCKRSASRRTCSQPAASTRTLYRRAGLAFFLALASSHAAAQALQTGPEFLRGGEYLIQVNRGDTSFDPNEIQRSSIWGTDEVRNNRGGRGINISGADVYEEPPEREGIVDVEFTVKADGSVADVELVGGFYDEEFKQAALDGIATTTFDPPKAGDTPVDWPHYSMRIVLRAPILPAMTPELVPEIQQVIDLLTAKNYAEAETLAKDLLANRAQTLFDYAVLQDQLASVYAGMERPFEALVALRNATQGSKAVPPQSQPNSRLAIQEERYPDEYLLPDLYLKALERKFLVAASLNQTGEALNTFALLEARKGLAADSSIRTQAEAIRAKLASEEPIGAQIRLVNGSWTYETSTRRVFGFTGLQGQVDSVDIACKDSRRRRMTFTNDSEFGLPASWQDCKLEFHGADGAQFLLYEYLN
ncbi:MAG: hypothetical protein RLZZ227_1160 [Pseudomonadota bacterium]|jgi:TonB family protein